MLSTGKISSANGRAKTLKEPDYNSIKACSREPQGLVGTWDNKTLMYRAKIKGKQLERALYGQYKIALNKIGRLYQKINKEVGGGKSKTFENNPQLVKFFKTIDPSANKYPNKAIEFDIDSLFRELRAKAEGTDAKLIEDDIYLLKNLLKLTGSYKKFRY